MSLNIEILKKNFGLDFAHEIDPILNESITHYNGITAILNDEAGYSVRNMYWNLIPNYADKFKPPYNWFNIQKEKLEVPYQRSRLQQGRCIIPVNSFFENKESHGKPVYKTVNKVRKKQSYSFSSIDNPILLLGGIYDIWNKDSKGKKYSCSIITMPPNEIIGEVHHRIPFITPSDKAKVWLDKAIEDTVFLSELIQPYPSDMLTRKRAWPPDDPGDLFDKKV